MFLMKSFPYRISCVCACRVLSAESVMSGVSQVRVSVLLLTHTWPVLLDYANKSVAAVLIGWHLAHLAGNMRVTGYSDC